METPQIDDEHTFYIREVAKIAQTFACTYHSPSFAPVRMPQCTFFCHPLSRFNSCTNEIVHVTSYWKWPFFSVVCDQSRFFCRFWGRFLGAPGGKEERFSRLCRDFIWSFFMVIFVFMLIFFGLGADFDPCACPVVSRCFRMLVSRFLARGVRKCMVFPRETPPARTGVCRNCLICLECKKASYFIIVLGYHPQTIIY